MQSRLPAFRAGGALHLQGYNGAFCGADRSSAPRWSPAGALFLGEEEEKREERAMEKLMRAS